MYFVRLRGGGVVSSRTFVTFLPFFCSAFLPFAISLPRLQVALQMLRHLSVVGGETDICSQQTRSMGSKDQPQHVFMYLEPEEPVWRLQMSSYFC